MSVYMDQTIPLEQQHKLLTKEKWSGSLEQGESFEAFIRDWLDKQGIKSWKPEDKKYDLMIEMEVPLYGPTTFTGECKQDTTAQRTNKLALQTHDQGRPAGINKDGPYPDLWFHSTGIEFWVIPTYVIRSVCQAYANSWGETVPMGDIGMGCRGVLMPMTVAKNIEGGAWHRHDEPTAARDIRVKA